MGIKLKEYRENCHLTQIAVAKYLNITQSQLSFFESGKSLLNTSQILKLCELLKCNPNELLGFKVESKRESKNTYKLKNATNYDIFFLLKKAIPFHVTKLAESFLNLQLNYMISKSQNIELLEHKIMFDIFSETMNTGIHKIMFDKSGDDVITLPRFVEELDKRENWINSYTRIGFDSLKSEVLNLEKKHEETRKMIKLIRDNNHAHILLTTIDKKPLINEMVKNQVDNISPLIIDIIRVTSSLLNLFYIKSEVDDYLYLEVVLKKRWVSFLRNINMERRSKIDESVFN